MSRIFTFLLILLIASVHVFAQDQYETELFLPAFSFVPFYAEVIQQEGESSAIPQNIQNNQFFLESLRLEKLAQDTYEYGDYEASAGFAEEAIINAKLSDEYVATQLLVEAKRLVDWADFYNIAERHPNNVQLGKDHYVTAVALHSDESWNESSDSSIKSIEVLSVLLAGTGAVTSDRPATSGGSSGTTSSSGNQYTVRTWAVEKDCFWNIAGYSWVYGDPWKWRTLYEANKHKIPNPNNPDLIEPGTVLDIPR
jgi:hypothetical protein